ncbi:MAG TPA: TonB-dependent receptor [Sphingobacteriaceae bacterium]|nr:TonB-dependent receptor [Sphingobacteriaceae bacterium]
MKTKLFAILLLLSVFSRANAQTEKGSISGKVIDETNQPAMYATVSLHNSKDSTLVRGTISNLDGDYSLDNISAGSYFISVTMLGYDKSRSAVQQLGAGAKISVATLKLKKLSNQLKEVSITVKKPLIENQIDKTVLNVENSALATGNNVMELLQKAPGVTVDKDDKINLRGKSGVQVMIDGKPSYLSQEQLANLLRATDASNIQSIEIITNPSSKYDASGNSGIINIKMKKNQSFGTNGTLTVGGGYGKRHKADGNASLNHREKLFNVFSNYSYGNYGNFHTLAVDRLLNTSGGTTYFSSSSYDKNDSENHNYKGGIDFFLGSKNTLGFLTSGNVFRGHNHETGINKIGATIAASDSSVVADNHGRSPYDFATYNINYKSVLDSSGTELTANLDYSRSAGDQDNYYNSSYMLGNGTEKRPPLLFRNYTPNVADIYSAKVDFTHPFSKKTKLETGLKSSYVKTDNNLNYSTKQADGSYQNDAARSNQFQYTEVISAAYVSLSTEPFKDFSIQAGLRAENTHSEGNSITDGTVVARNYLNFFPTVYLKQKLSAKNTIGVSYSRRIDRPDYGSLNPFLYFIDQYLYAKGNPYLNPQYTNSFEMNYIYRDSYSTSLNYSRTTGGITQVLLTNPVNKALFQTNENLATQTSLSLNINAPVTIAKWWKTNNNVTIFHNEVESPNIGGADFSTSKTAWMLNTNHSLTVTKTTGIELNGSYNSPSVSGTFNVSSFYGVDFGINQSFADKKFNLKLGVNDFLNTRTKQSVSSNLENNTYAIHQNYESRVVRMSLTWRFGNSNVKSVDKHGGSESEQNRLKK